LLLSIGTQVITTSSMLKETRRLVAWRIDYDEECREEALWDLRHNGSASRLIGDGDRVCFPRSYGQRKCLLWEGSGLSCWSPLSF
jgi:hypothetical protein